MTVTHQKRVGGKKIFFKPLIDHLSRQRRLYLYMNIYVQPPHYSLSLSDNGTTGAWPLLPVDHGTVHQNSPANTYYQARSVMTFAPYMGYVTLGQGTFGTWYMLPSNYSMVDSVTGLRFAERSRAPHHITNGHGFPMQTTSCTWP